jgi:hypothetical protein
MLKLRSEPMELATEYNERCRADSGLREVMTQVPLPPAFRACWGDRLLARPLFVRADDMTAAASDVLRVFALLASLPHRLFGGDLGRYCQALGFDRDRAALVRRFAGAAPVQYGRADLYHDGTGFRLLEFNVASDIGGTQHGQLARALSGWSPFREFALDHGLAYTDTSGRVAAALAAAAAPLAGQDPPSVLVLCEPGGIDKDPLVLAGLTDMLARYGIRAFLAEPGALRYRSGRVTVHGTDIHVVLRYFNLDDLAGGPGSDGWARLLLRAHQDGQVVMWTGLDSAAYSHKAALAFLSGPRWRDTFAPEEVAVVDRLLPVTRLLRDEFTMVDGQEINVLDYARERQASLVLKPVRGWGGRQVVPGWECSEQQWKTLLGDCAGGGYLIQQRVVPRPEPVVNPKTGATENWAAVYGMFVTPAGYAGAHGRAVPAGSGSVVSYSLTPQARTSTVFTCGR